MTEEAESWKQTALKAVTFTIVIGISGILFLVLSIVGTLRIGGNVLAVPTTPLRVFAAAVGLVLLIAALWLEWSDRAAKHAKKQRGAVPLKSTPPALQLQRLDHASTEPFPAMVEEAIRVDILARTGVNLLNQFTQTIKDLSRQGCEIRLLFVDPESDAAKYVYGDSSALYRHNAGTAATHVRSLLTVGRQFHVRVTKHAPTLSLIIVDRRDAADAFAHVQLYFLHAAVESNRPVFRVRRDDPWFSIFRDEFDKLWQEGKDWNPSPNE